MKMLSGELADRLRLEIGYKSDDPKICKNCEHFRTSPNGAHDETRCGIIDVIGYFEVWEEATCNKFSRKS